MLTLRLNRPTTCAASNASLFAAPFERLFAGFPLPEAAFTPIVDSGASRASTPPTNVWEDDANVYVEMELPGLTLDKLDITFAGNELSISGERTAATPENAVVHRRERSVGTFTRTLRLATPIDSDRVSATFEKGVLEVTLPKAHEARTRKIAVKTN